MKNKMFICILLVICLTNAIAHSGRTDSNGGHWNRKTGTYHYHNGGTSSSGSKSSSNSNSWSSITKVTIDDIGKYVYVIQDANLRKGPGSEYEVIKIMKKDSLVKIIKIEGSWANVELIDMNSVNAWISMTLLKK